MNTAVRAGSRLQAGRATVMDRPDKPDDDALSKQALIQCVRARSSGETAYTFA